MHRLGQGASPSERPDRTIWRSSRKSVPILFPIVAASMDSTKSPASVSKTCLVRFDNNKYSVSASAVGRPVEIHAYADRVVIRQDGRIVAEHPRRFGRGQTIQRGRPPSGNPRLRRSRRDPPGRAHRGGASAPLIHSHRCPKDLQRPAPSHLPRHAPDPPRGSDLDVASRHRGVSQNWDFRLRAAKFSLVTAPLLEMAPADEATAYCFAVSWIDKWSAGASVGRTLNNTVLIAPPLAAQNRGG